MRRKKFMAIHTYHSQETKNSMWSGVSELKRTDFEWEEGWTFEKCECVATWVGSDDFFFCHWEADDPQDILDTLTAKGHDEFIFTALYEIDVHIDTKNLTGGNPFTPLNYLDSST